MRAALLLVVLAALPFAPQAAASAAYAGEDGCLAGGGRILGFGVAYPGCSLSHDGAVEFVSCDGNACTFLVSVSTVARGLPVGARAVATSVDHSFAPSFTTTVCAVSDVATEARDVSCEGVAETVLVFGGGDCRFLTIETTASADQVVAGARLLSEFRVCLADDGATFEAV